MNILSISLEKSKSIDYERACQYDGIKICLASFSSMIIDTYQKENYCSTEDYDNCPIFLAKVLRRS